MGPRTLEKTNTKNSFRNSGSIMTMQNVLASIVFFCEFLKIKIFFGGNFHAKLSEIGGGMGPWTSDKIKIFRKFFFP